MNNSNTSNNCKGYPKPSKVITTQPADIWGRRWFLVVAYAPNRGLCMVMRCCGGDAALYGLLLCLCLVFVDCDDDVVVDDDCDADHDDYHEHDDMLLMMMLLLMMTMMMMLWWFTRLVVLVVSAVHVKCFWLSCSLSTRT